MFLQSPSQFLLTYLEVYRLALYHTTKSQICHIWNHVKIAVFERVENIVGKKENAGYQCFKKHSPSGSFTLPQTDPYFHIKTL